jgi:transcriptional regulator with XRE-family HTH domain
MEGGMKKGGTGRREAPKLGGLGARAAAAAHQREQVTQIGARLRRLRLMRRMSLRELAARVGCTVSMLSKVESGQASPSLKLLTHWCDVLQTSYASVFEEAEPEVVVVQRAGQRQVVWLDSGQGGMAPTRLEQLVPYAEGRKFNANLYTVPPGGGSQGLLSHDGEEVGYVIAGTVELCVAGQVYRLGAGASFYFPSHLPHSYRNVGRTPARILWVGAG